MAASFLTTFSNVFSWLKNVIISIKISLKFVLKGSINNIPTLVQIMAWHRPGDKPLSEQWWLDYQRIYASLGLNELTMLVDLVWGTTTEAMVSSSQLMWSIAIILPGLFPIVLWVVFCFFFLRWWPPSTMWVGPLIILWPPPGMSEYQSFEFGIICCMLSTFHVS